MPWTRWPAVAVTWVSVHSNSRWKVSCEKAGSRGGEPLSMREKQIVMQVLRGKSSAAIAASLFLSPKTVDSYRSRVMAKLGVDDLPALVRLAIREGWIDLDDA